MNGCSPDEILNVTVKKGIEKSQMSYKKIMILAFLGGAFIALGYLAYIRVAGNMPHEWGSLPHLIGASVFPIGLILILLGGGELITGNMMVVGTAWFARKVSFVNLAINWLLVTFFNLLGAIFVAYLFGHVIGLTEGVFTEKTVMTAQAKVDASFIQAFISGIGCNWLVGISVWLSFGAKDFAGKILAIWFPVMIFVLIGFQHVVANFFVIPAAIFLGKLTWIDFLFNVIPVWLGNAAGGAILVGGLYSLAYYQKNDEEQRVSSTEEKFFHQAISKRAN
ncbi:formate/nitrite transporter family protein [Neobacillus sp. OS1-32]|uniref:formate/nitrite transporter family protein n=1 Tax=Neobacillus sp. OS1-32 TaxID=3070682 RepID=UPI0027E15008|nr:formate/nitrite transporter family protein [Neobacillus sp. OS1-32]WML31995.1 formate/nitrite transporter family protein [Neobacillus sp. OS1-32]